MDSRGTFLAQTGGEPKAFALNCNPSPFYISCLRQGLTESLTELPKLSSNF